MRYLISNLKNPTSSLILNKDLLIGMLKNLSHDHYMISAIDLCDCYQSIPSLYIAGKEIGLVLNWIEYQEQKDLDFKKYLQEN